MCLAMGHCLRPVVERLANLVHHGADEQQDGDGEDDPGGDGHADPPKRCVTGWPPGYLSITEAANPPRSHRERAR